MCVVEVTGDEPVIQTACTLIARKGLETKTDTEAVRHSRKCSLSLLLKRSPNSLLLRDLALSYQLAIPARNESDFDQTGECVLCGLCIKACKVLGISAIQFAGKGKDRQVKLILEAGHSPCIGCRACEKVCIARGQDNENAGSIPDLTEWISGLAQAFCKNCGRPYAALAAVNFIAAQIPSAKARLGLCPECKRAVSISPRIK